MTSLECWGLYLSVHSISSKNKSRQKKEDKKVNFLQFKGNKSTCQTVLNDKHYFFEEDHSFSLSSAHQDLVGSPSVASVCECDSACCTWAVSLQGEHYCFPGHPDVMSDPHLQHSLQTSDASVPSARVHLPVFSFLLRGHVDMRRKEREKIISSQRSKCTDSCSV